MRAKLYQVWFTEAELDQILTCVYNTKVEGTYYGNRKQYEKRADRIMAEIEKVHEAKLANSEEGNRWLEAQIRDLEAKLAKVVEALREIEEGAGPFDRDPLKHASNCVEAMRATARAALAAAKGGE